VEVDGVVSAEQRPAPIEALMLDPGASARAASSMWM
jgi:hypothetical protein